MRFKYLLVLLCFSILFGNSNNDNRGYIVEVGDLAPDFTTRLTTGEKVKLSDLKGSIVVLQFTASWCSVCRKEMPHLEKDVWQQFKEKGLVLIGIDRDDAVIAEANKLQKKYQKR